MSLNTKIGIDNIYVVHGITGYALREEMVNDLLGKQYGLNYEFVTESNNNIENEAWINQYFTDDVRTVLKKGALLCTLVHVLIYERFLKTNNKYALIFENDICFLGSFTDKISRIVNEANHLEEGFIISLENSTLLFPSWKETQKGKYLYQAKKGRCAGAYMIDQKAARDILDDLKVNKCREVIDWWHNSLINRKIIKMYWAHPPITEQGSFNGKFSSSISVRDNGVLRRFKWSMQKFYKMYIIRWFK